MPTEHSWTEVRRGAADLGWLLRFRSSGLSARSRRRLRTAGITMLLLTVAAAAVPAYLRAPLEARDANRLVAVLPSLYLGFLLLAVLSAIASGGGREVVPRDQAVAFPVSSVTEHLGALLLAPLNIAWIIQSWTLLGATAYVLGPTRLWASMLPVLVWIAAATALGQFLGWLFEGIRRGPFGLWVTRGIGLLALAAVVRIVLTHHTTDVLDRSPTVSILLTSGAGSAGAWLPWLRGVAELAAIALLAVAGGLVPARWALHRPQRAELRMESGHRPARRHPASDLAAMLRVDRASIWRSVPLRRGVLVLGLMPGAVALAGGLEWDVVTILPGLVASGGALLFGVNTWCLDGRGALWRESLPVRPEAAYVAKVVVLLELLLAAASLTILLAALRAGMPTSAELVATLAGALVVCVQVVASCMRWSVQRPFAVDLRSARATPAPPVVMAGYSARLAAKTTITGMLFSAAAAAPDWRVPALLAVPFLCWSGYRLARTARRWSMPEVRSGVVAVVAG